MTILDGKKLSQEIKAEIKKEVELLKQSAIVPALAVILVGDDAASKTYVSNKAKACESCGIKSILYELAKETSQQELLALINTLNYDDSIDGILVQLPLPSHISKDIVIQSINSNKDVDGFHPSNVGFLHSGIKGSFLPCTPAGVIELLKAYKISLAGLNAVIIGASNIVGKPMAAMLLNEGATISICHLQTKDISLYTRQADLIVCAAGSVNLLKADMIKDEAIVVDVGINRINNTLVGDVDFENVSKKASFISPVPGGVGPMTIAMLLKNTIRSAKNRLRQG